jgi:pyrimidine-specific ribonucleoside hydrolase
MNRIILDTDIGGDPDDAIALLLALSSPEISLDLIVTNDEHQGHRALFAGKLLAELGYNIPIARGGDIGNSKYCLVHDLVQGVSPQIEYISKIRRFVERNDETFYVCIGPQTNLANFLEAAPDLHEKLVLVMMGGAVDYRRGEMAEHNIRYDIPAARKVFNALIPKHYVISDTTFNDKLIVDKHHNIYKRIAEKSPLLQKSFDAFFDYCYPESMMHDPLTLSTIIDPSFVQFERVKLHMDETGILRKNQTDTYTKVSSSARYEEFMLFLEKRIESLLYK